MTSAARQLISTEGAVFVSLAAAEQYQRAARDNLGARMGIEEARRELTRHMLRAHRTPSGSVRLRSREHDIDISAHATVEDGLVIITSCHVRLLSAS